MIKTIHGFNKKGFTLIELLIVVAIIAILAAIAIPQFGAYRRRGFNASAVSDLRTIRTTQEAMQADFQDYGTSNTAQAAQGIEMTSTLSLNGAVSTTAQQQISLSRNVYTAVKSSTNVAGTGRGDYAAVTTHASGDNYYAADSDTTTQYRQGWGPTTYTAGQTGTKCPTPTSPGNDFSSGWSAL